MSFGCELPITKGGNGHLAVGYRILEFQGKVRLRVEPLVIQVLSVDELGGEGIWAEKGPGA